MKFLFAVKFRNLEEEIAVLFGRNFTVFSHLVNLDDIGGHVAESIEAFCGGEKIRLELFVNGSGGQFLIISHIDQRAEFYERVCAN